LISSVISGKNIQTKQKLSKKMLIRSAVTLFCFGVSYQALSAPTFYGNFESGTVTGVGNRNWRNIQASAPGRISLIKDTRGIYAKVQVRNYEPRSEVVMMQDAYSNPIYENLSSGIERYTLSVKIDPSWQVPAWSVFTQLHGPDELSTNPAFALEASNRFTFSMRAGDISRNRGAGYELLNGNLNKGQWVDFIITVKYAANNTGFVTIHRRNQGQVGYTQVLNLVNIPTLQYSSNVNGGRVGNHYMKHGLYTSPSNFTNTLYLDNFTRTKM